MGQIKTLFLAIESAASAKKSDSTLQREKFRDKENSFNTGCLQLRCGSCCGTWTRAISWGGKGTRYLKLPTLNYLRGAIK